MAYTKINFKTKKALKEAFLSAIHPVEVFQPNADITGARFTDGEVVVIEGPHYPEPHRWYCRVKLRKSYRSNGSTPKDEEIFTIEKIIG